MKRTTRCGLRITAAPFWLTWRGAAPDQYQKLSLHPINDNSQPLSEAEAVRFWLTAEPWERDAASYETQDMVELCRDLARG